VGLAAFLIGIAIVVYRPQMPATPVIVVGGAGMFVAAVLAGLFVSRELTLSPPWLRLGMEEFNPASEVVVFSLAALLWYYPRPLYRFPVAALFASFVTMFWMNEWLQLRDLPPHTYIPQYLVSYLAMIVFAVMQWRHTREDALSRAALKWFLLVNIVVGGLFNILSVVPIAYGQPSIIGKADTFFLGPLIYFGLAFGVARYRLFDIERWWIEVWLWLGGGLLVIGIDVLLISLFQLAKLLALAFALILAGWVYLPIRQWLFRRLLRPSNTRLDDHFPLLIETLFHDGPGRTFGERWRDLLQRVFAPAALTMRAAPAVRAELVESGLSLRVPSFEGDETHELRFREQGRRLYTPRDVALADMLLSLTRRAAELWQQREEGARAERGRIMRDLHDDVAARLLSLMHRARDPALYNQAHETLSVLRQTIYALDDSRPITLPDLMTELQALARERLRDTGVTLDWLDPLAASEVNLSARQRVNLTRVVQEALANALRHAAPATIRVRWEVNDGRLSLQFCNDGAILRTEDWQAGKGTANIRVRMAELGGEAQWNVTLQDSKPVCCLQIALPLT
jgi:signal transduction histidine kinase